MHFTGYESRLYDEVDHDERYVRVCTEDEIDLLESDRARIRASERAEEEALRDAWFELLREEQSEIRHPGLEPG